MHCLVAFFFKYHVCDVEKITHSVMVLSVFKIIKAQAGQRFIIVSFVLISNYENTPKNDMSDPLTLKAKLKIDDRRERDLEKRSINGAFVYAPIWAVIGIGTRFIDSSPYTFYGVLFAFIMMGAIRLFSHRYSTALKTKSRLLWNLSIYFNALAPALTLAILFSLTLLYSSFAPMFLFLLLSVFGVLSGGIVNFSPRPDVSASYIIVLLVPPFLSLVLLSTDRYLEAGLLVIYGSYMFLLGRKMNEEYIQRVLQQLELERLNQEDSLTGIANRRSFDDTFNTLWTTQTNHAGVLSLVLIDIDKFKNINDKFGHAYGDQVIKEVAQCIKTASGTDTSIVARIGGEEFAILLVSVSNDALHHLAENIRLQVEALAFNFEDNLVQTSISLGVASIIPNTESSPAKLFQIADSRLYKAKQQGRNRVVVAG